MNRAYIGYWDNEYFDETPVQFVIESFFNEDNGYSKESINKINNLKVNELVEIELGHVVIRVR